jgi:hypothetical protein
LQYGPTAFAFEQVADLFGVLLLVGEVRQDEVGAFTRHRDGGGTADARVGTGDDAAEAGQPFPADVALLAVVRLRVHLPGGSRERLLLLRERRGGVEAVRVALVVLAHGSSLLTGAGAPVQPAWSRPDGGLAHPAQR